MRCKIDYKDGITNSTYPFLHVSILADTPPEGMELGLIAMRLRRANIWCVIDKDKAQLEVQVKK